MLLDTTSIEGALFLKVLLCAELQSFLFLQHEVLALRDIDFRRDTIPEQLVKVVRIRFLHADFHRLNGWA